jgi:uncharacterized protein YaeQ
LAGLAERSMRLGITVQDGHVLVSGAKGSAELEPQVWQKPAPPR